MVDPGERKEIYRSQKLARGVLLVVYANDMCGPELVPLYVRVWRLAQPKRLQHP